GLAADADHDGAIVLLVDLDRHVLEHPGAVDERPRAKPDRHRAPGNANRTDGAADDVGVLVRGVGRQCDADSGVELVALAVKALAKCGGLAVRRGFASLLPGEPLPRLQLVHVW